MKRVMEEVLKRELSTVQLVALGRSGGGCISDGQSYQTDSGKVFVKYNTDSKAKLMFDGELASLNAIISTHTIRVPKPMKVVEHPEKGWIFIMEHLEMVSLRRYQAQLGEQLARLHLHNASLKSRKGKSLRVGRGQEGTKSEEEEDSVGGGYVDKFGFECQTCCGFIPMPNEWHSNWIDFYTQQRLQVQLDLIEKEYGDREVRELWPRLQSRIPSFFEGIEVEPALLHGDAWSGNVSEDENGAIIFDPASFYGHHEFELAIAGMFGGFTKQFYDAYHKLIPQAPGFALRHKFYILFHYLNHWNHFGAGYRSQSIAIMKELL